MRQKLDFLRRNFKRKASSQRQFQGVAGSGTTGMDSYEGADAPGEKVTKDKTGGAF
jgi:hypothetical protein